MHLRTALLMLCACALAAADPAVPTGTKPLPRQLFAHYMGCFPIGYGALPALRKEQRGLRHDALDQASQLGGRIHAWPLMPDDLELSPVASAELEIRRAIRGGVDGFAIDAWAGDLQAKATLDALFAAAEAGHLPFSITICIDCSCLPANAEHPGDNTVAVADAVSYLVSKHGQSPNLARRAGKPLIFGYSSYAILQDQAMKAMPEGPDKWRKTADAYREVERRVGTPLYFHYCLSHYAHHCAPQTPAPFLDYVAFMAKNFSALGGFLDSDFPGGRGDLVAAQAIAAGAEWSQPMWYQYDNVLGSMEPTEGTRKLQECWRQAIASTSTLMQFVTWNDYGENTILAPNLDGNYGILEINAHYARWWKTGTEPVPEQDLVIVAYRKYPPGAHAFPFHSRRDNPGSLEVITLLRAPGEVSVGSRGATYTAPRGLHVQSFPIAPGEVSAEVTRAGKRVARVDAPELITDVPFREDNGLCAFSSDHDAQWSADFPGVPAIRYSEYADLDHDGLPNWFEMYWSHSWLDATAMTQLDPASDPWQAGRTLLTSLRERKDPTRKDPVYAPGFVWDIAEVAKRDCSFNPDVDSQGQAVWSYLYRHGPYGRMDHAGAFSACQLSAHQTPYTGLMAHLSPYHDDTYHEIHGWTSWHRDQDGAPWWFELRPRREAMIGMAWTSPVAGSVRMHLRVETSAKDALWFGIRDAAGHMLVERTLPGGEPAVDCDSPAVPCAVGDQIILMADSAPGQGLGSLRLSKLTVELIPATGSGTTP